jgi:hypothetical protein
MCKHGETAQRAIRVVNLDPAAEQFDYEPLAGLCFVVVVCFDEIQKCVHVTHLIYFKYLDIRELISLEDVMEAEDVKLGPNGGLIYCMQHFIDNLDWLEEAIGFCDDDYILFDCPGKCIYYYYYL